MMAIRIWVAQLDRRLNEGELQTLSDILPPARKERLLRMKDGEKREQVLCAYGLLLALLREEYGWNALPEICLTPTGKPYFPQHPEVSFSISHTDGAVMAVLGEEAVGADIERIRPVSDRLRERMAPESTPASFFSGWVRREARAKCSGNGIGEFLHGEPPCGEEERYLEVDAFPGYAAGTAWSGAAECGEIRRLVWSRDLSDTAAAFG